MRDQTILSPYFLDQPLADLEEPATRDWTVNKPELPVGDILQRLSAIHRPLAEFTRQTIEKSIYPPDAVLTTMKS